MNTFIALLLQQHFQIHVICEYLLEKQAKNKQTNNMPHLCYFIVKFKEKYAVTLC